MDASPQHEPEINKLFRLATKHGASDLCLRVGSAPLLKLRGVDRLTDLRPLTQQDLERLVSPILHADQRQRLGLGEKVDFTYAVEEGVAYRVGVSREGGQLSLSARRLAFG
ncbi:MAG: hypothetical protein K2W96_12635 [Gemmataceae bacterium]|nr:hypothetical protein [Gemmataceae bacterium]